jgi:hypothetical protein
VPRMLVMMTVMMVVVLLGESVAAGTCPRRRRLGVLRITRFRRRRIGIASHLCEGS